MEWNLWVFSIQGQSGFQHVLGVWQTFHLSLLLFVIWAQATARVRRVSSLRTISCLCFFKGYFFLVEITLCAYSIKVWKWVLSLKVVLSLRPWFTVGKRWTASSGLWVSCCLLRGLWTGRPVSHWKLSQKGCWAGGKAIDLAVNLPSKRPLY